MRIEDQTPIPLSEPKTVRDRSVTGEDSTSQNPQHIRSQYAADQLEIFTESFPGDPATQSPQLLDDLVPDRIEPYRPENLFDDQVKIDVFSNVPGNRKMDQGFDPANLTADPANPTKTDVDRHYLGGNVNGAGGDALKNALGATGADSLKDAMNLNPTTSQNTSGENVPRFRAGGSVDSAGSGGGGGSSTVKEGGGGDSGGSTVYGGNSPLGGRNMSLVAAKSTTTKETTTTKDTVEVTKLYDADGKLKYSVETSTDDGVTTMKGYDGDGNYLGKYVTSADGQAVNYDKDGKQIKYTTEEGDTIMQAPSVEEFLRIKNFGGGYTDVRPELQSDVPKEQDPAKGNRYFGLIDVNPDYTEEALAAPNFGNVVQPETRPELEGPAPELPPTPGGDPNSNDSN